jgi:hypothetical protein
MHQPVGMIALARLSVLVSLALLAVVLLACQANQTTSVSPVAGLGLVALPTEIDLGRVPFDQSADAHFIILNSGTTTVNLDQNVEVQTLEGC